MQLILTNFSQDLYGRMSETGGAPGLFEAKEQDQWDHLADVDDDDDDNDDGDDDNDEDDNDVGGESMESGDGDTSGKRRRLE